ncbi:MAG: molybdotransferase-like divisome protein Glp [Mycobacteriales bacterium]
MRSVDEHLAEILSVVAPLAPLDVPLGEAHGCLLAEDVLAPAPLPGFDNSAMDGYAVRCADLVGASAATPVRLVVAGEIAAGEAPRVRVQPGCAARIFTGAMVPEGADAVIPQEHVEAEAGAVLVRAAPAAGACIRRAGEDLARGSRALTAGTPLGAAQIGLLAAVGQARVRVQPRPRFVVLSTGSEVLEPGEPLGPGQLYDANSHALAAAAREAGAVVYRVGAVPDDPHRFLDTLEDHLIRADAVLTSGGVSVGDHDVVKEALARAGTVSFVQVAMQPGMPQGFGVVGPESVPLFALPGNPSSALVSFEVFVRPALRRMLAAEPLLRPHVTASWQGSWTSPAGKRQYVRGVLGRRTGGGYDFTPSGGAGSHLLAPFAGANALAVVGENAVAVAPGEEVSVMLLERRVR